MYKILSLTIIAIILLSSTLLAQSYTYHDGYHLGESEAKELRGIKWGWLMGGFAGGSLLNIIGGGGVVALAWLDEPEIESETMKELERRPISYSLGYREGFTGVVRSKNMRHATIGASIGVILNTTALAFIYLLFYN